MSIQKHRGAIDKIDAQIVKLLNRRTKHVLGIGQAKLASGKAIYQPDRDRLSCVASAKFPTASCLMNPFGTFTAR